MARVSDIFCLLIAFPPWAFKPPGGGKKPFPISTIVAIYSRELASGSDGLPWRDVEVEEIDIWDSLRLSLGVTPVVVCFRLVPRLSFARCCGLSSSPLKLSGSAMGGVDSMPWLLV